MAFTTEKQHILLLTIEVRLEYPVSIRFIARVIFWQLPKIEETPTSAFCMGMGRGGAIRGMGRGPCFMFIGERKTNEMSYI